MQTETATRKRSLLLWSIFFVTRTLIFLYGHQATGDVKIYFEHATRALGGGNPYGDEPFGYPPLALAFVLLPALFARGSAGVYYQAFRLECYLVDFAVFLLLNARSKSKLAPLAYCLTTFVLGNLIYHRLDLALGLLLLLAWLSYERERVRTAFFLLGLGVAFKVIPIVLLPAALAWEWRKRGRGALFALGAWSLGLGIPTLLGLRARKEITAPFCTHLHATFGRSSIANSSTWRHHACGFSQSSRPNLTQTCAPLESVIS